MTHYLTTTIGRLRLAGFFEGVSALILFFIAMPYKYIWDERWLVAKVGMIHGVLFLIFVLATIMASIEYEWKFKETTWKVLLASIVPFGPFYVDAKILKDYSKE